MTAVWLLIACTWKAALLVGLGALLLRLWPRSSAAERHAAWAVVILALLALPVLSLFWNLVPLPIENTSAQQAFTIGEHTVITVFGGKESAAVMEALQNGSALVGILWAMGALIALMRLGMGYRRARRYLQLAEAFEPDTSGWAERRGPGVGYPVLLSPLAAMPMAIGLVKPSIVLPADAPSWEPGQLRRVLLHETAHLERWDPVWKFAGSLVAALYWFHPLVWLALRQFSSEREQACDDMVLADGGPPSRYASDLIAFARNTLNRSVPRAAIPMASPTRLEARVAAILDATKPRQSLRRNNMTVYTCILTLLLLPLSALTSLAHPLPAPGAMDVDLNGSLTAMREAASHSVATAKLRAQVAASVNKLEAAVAANGTESPQPVAAPAASPAPEPVAAAQDTPPSRIRVGGNVQAAKLIKKVNPVYPPEAKAEGVQGTVRLNVRIDKEGFVVETEVETSPDDRLSESAVEAVRQWVYAPTLLNGNPVEVLTVIDVNYTLQK